MKAFASDGRKTAVLMVFTALCLSLLCMAPVCSAQNPVRPGGSAQKPPELMPGSAALISPEELVKILQSQEGQKPLILSIGPRLLWAQAHIPGAEFIGPTSDAAAVQLLRDRVKSLPRSASVVLYCGCCPWSHCPNVEPAYQELRRLGFTKVKVLYIANNLGADWVYKSYPTVRGQ
jgi:hypothetical protein